MKQPDKDLIESALQHSNMNLVEHSYRIYISFIHMTEIFIFINVFIFLQLSNMNRLKIL